MGTSVPNPYNSNEELFQESKRALHLKVKKKKLLPSFNPSCLIYFREGIQSAKAK